MTKRLALSAAAAAAFSTGVLWAQQAPAPAAPQDAAPPVIFRVEVDYVEADVLVTDAQNNPVNDLKAEEFEVLEDGKPQKVTSFSRVDIPIERAERPLFATAPVEQDVQTNDHTEGRIYLIVLDDLHTEFTRTPRVKAAMRRFFERSFGTNDLAAIVFTGRSNGSQDFTNNPRLLMAAVDKFIGRKLPSATINKIEGARVDPDTRQMVVGDDKDMMERSFNARNAMGTVRKLAEFMANVRGRRKALLLVGEGVDYDIHEAVGLAGSTASAVLLDTHDAIASATRGNVSIYAIDPRGLSTGSEDLITQSSTFPEQGAGLQSMSRELTLSQDSLRVLAANTGGFAAVNRNDFNTAFDRIVQENSQYYLLGYYSTNSRRDGRYRKIQVRVTRPGLRVARARNGYYEARGRRPADAAPGATNPALSAAIASPLPVAGMPVKVFAGAFKGEAPNAAVAVVLELDASKLDFVEANGTFNESLEIANAATNSTGKVFPGERNTAKLALKPDTYKSAREHGFRLLTQMNLPPGKYQLRLAAANATGKAGSVLYDLEIPDFYKASFAMSGVAITSVAASLTPTVRAKNPLGDFLPGPPVATREFMAGDTLMFFAEFYENGANNKHKVDLKAELRADDGRVVLTASEERESSEVKGGGYGFAGRLPLSELTPGLYVLHIEGKSRVGDNNAASRDIQVRIK
ncbi:MAG TPA: VWA domain-containing protein [Vicinamibacterales bacterium]|jgi:VWFA-related protein|nr:VWA domain-containing protein [Vicinamibacterales bacterium]